MMWFTEIFLEWSKHVSPGHQCVLLRVITQMIYAFASSIRLVTNACKCVVNLQPPKQIIICVTICRELLLHMASNTNSCVSTLMKGAIFALVMICRPGKPPFMVLTASSEVSHQHWGGTRYVIAEFGLPTALVSCLLKKRYVCCLLLGLPQHK